MRPPGFWFTPPDRPDPRARLLAPLGWLYGQITARRRTRADAWRAPVPVICTGSLTGRGTGRTPTVQALALHLQARGRRPAILCGDATWNRPVVAVDAQTHTAADVGDEALLAAAFAPTWVAGDLGAGMRAIVEAEPATDCILLDGGLQDPCVFKDLALVAVDAVDGFGNGLCRPAGPLDIPLSAGLARADLILSIGPPAAQKAFRHAWRHRLPEQTIRGRMEALPTGMDWRDARVMAFAGLDHPEKFFGVLRRLGADLIRAEPLEDHQPLTPALMTRLAREAQILGAQLVTTERDAVRLPAAFRREVLTLPVRLRIEDSAPLDAALHRIGL
jgi:tetraacyldisaccharide 4'-kinase